jgi:hypothetical protein
MKFIQTFGAAIEQELNTKAAYGWSFTFISFLLSHIESINEVLTAILTLCSIVFVITRTVIIHKDPKKRDDSNR